MKPLVLHYPDGDLLAGVVTRVRVIRDLRADGRKNISCRYMYIEGERTARTLFILKLELDKVYKGPGRA